MSQKITNNSEGSNLSSVDVGVIVILAVLQGLIFWLISEAAERKLWVFDTLFATLTGYALVFSGPTTFQLTVSFSRSIEAAISSIFVGIIFGSLAAYISWSATVDSQMFASDTVDSSAVSLFIAWFVLLPFLQCKLERDNFSSDYPRLYYFAWRNTMTLILTIIFIGICWMLLFFWGELFDVINVDFFSKLFKEEWFIYCVTGLFFGLGIVIARTQDRAVEVAHFILLSLLKWLLPVLCLILVGFLISLPITGFDTLLKSRVWSPVGILIAGLVLLVSFVNGVYRDGRQSEAYTKYIDKFIALTLIVAPVFASLCVYGLWIRITKYGWSVDRYWAAVITILLCAYVFGYAATQIASRGNVLRGLGKVNIFVAFCIIGIGIISNTPLMDPMKISAASQLGRLIDSSISGSEFDYRYLRRSLGKSGDKALKILLDREGEEYDLQRRKAALALSITSWRSRNSISDSEKLAALEKVEWIPSNADRDIGFLQRVAADRRDRWEINDCYWHPEQCRFVSIQLNEDTRNEYFLINKAKNCLRFSSVYAKQDELWMPVARIEIQGNCVKVTDMDWDNEIRVETPVWKNIRIGTDDYSVVPE